MWPTLVSRTVPLYRVGSAHVLFPFKMLIVFIWEGGLARFAKIPVSRAEISAIKPSRLLNLWKKSCCVTIEIKTLGHKFYFLLAISLNFREKYFYRYYYSLIFTLTTIRRERCDGVRLWQLTLFLFPNGAVALAYIATAIPLFFLPFLLDTNPLQLRIYRYPSLPYNIKAGTVIGNVTVTGKLASLVKPFLYYLDSVTQRQQHPRPTQRQSRTVLKRRRRDNVNDLDDVCEEAGTVTPLNYFCIHRLTGKIKVTEDFAFVDGEEFELKVRVTDCDPWGKTENAAVFQLISYDRCNEIRKFYDESVKFCGNVSSALVCPSVNCLVPLFNWQMALNTSSERLRSECSSDPQNMESIKQRYSSCIGKSYT